MLSRLSAGEDDELRGLSRIPPPSQPAKGRKTVQAITRRARAPADQPSLACPLARDTAPES
ncbi:hypothetical protein GCM10010304_81890 [Streptomyces roseoviolaceus]